MAKGAKSRTTAEAKRATKTNPPAKPTRAKASAASRVEPVAKRKEAEPAPAVAAKTARVASAAKPAVAFKSKPPAAKPFSSETKSAAPKAAAPKSPAPKAPARKSAARKAAARKPASEPRAVVAQPARAANGAAAPKRTPRRKAKLPFLAAELGQPVDHEGEPIGAGSRAAMSDTELQRYTLRLWQQMQSRRGVNTHGPAMERAGVTIDQIWTAGVTETLTTSSSPDDVRRYKQKLLFRANLLEAILTETVSELHRLNSVEPAPSRSVGESG